MKQELKQAEKSEKAEGRTLEATKEREMPIIVSARTGLAGKSDAIVRRVPVEYADKKLKDVLEYIIGEAAGEEASLAESVKKELRADNKVVVVNGKKADLGDKAEKYLTIKEHELPTGARAQYRELEIEVSAVQKGGYFFS